MHFKRSTSIVALCFLLFNFSGLSQGINPDFNQVFLQGEVSEIYIYMDESEKQLLLHPANVYDDTYYAAEFNFINSFIDTTLSNVGIRIRGNTSRNNPKKSLKIDFKEFGGDQFFKLKKLNLKPNNNDPSQMREYLTELMYRKMNVPAPRASYAEVYINDEYMGIYLNVENIDDEFVDRRFGNENGNLYKCFWGATLETSNDIYDNKLFELKTNEITNDRFKLESLIKLLDTKDDGTWSNKIQQVFDVDLYLRQLAVEAMTGHWDGYSYNINNFYLYENPETGKTVFLPYDMDNTWGIDWVGQDWGKRDVLHWSSNNFKTPLTTRILGIPQFKEKYIGYLHQVLGLFKNTTYFDSISNSIFDLLASSIYNDTYYSLTFGYSSNDFFDSYVAPFGRHVKYSISDYIETRIRYAQNQLPENVDIINTQVFNFTIYPNPSDGTFVGFTGKDYDSGTIQVFDLQGQPVKFKKDNENSLIFTPALLPGIYLLKMGTETKKFFVSN